MRRPIIAGNWKMHKNLTETKEFIEKLKSELSDIPRVEIIICPPFTSLQTAVEMCFDTAIKIAGQNMHWEKSGAYTGEISPEMLKELGVNYCIIGHSERRQYFTETDEAVNKKIKAALKQGIKPIICVGETLEEKEASLAFAVIEKQIKKALTGILASGAADLIFAYEPVWAIGTGKTASERDAQEAAAKIREVLKELFGIECSREIRILYGGSVKSNNIAGFMAEEDIDGALIGGASLEVESFLKLINY